MVICSQQRYETSGLSEHGRDLLALSLGVHREESRQFSTVRPVRNAHRNGALLSVVRGHDERGAANDYGETGPDPPISANSFLTLAKKNYHLDPPD